MIIFPEKGILIHAIADPDINRAGVSEVLYFQPMPLERVLQVFRNELSIVNDPFPQVSMPDIVRGDIDPWGVNVRE